MFSYLVNLLCRKEEVSAKIAHTTQHGAIEGKTQTQELVLYNLDVIISVGYRVKSKRGTAFRIWARNILKEYLVKGYAVNDRRCTYPHDCRKPNGGERCNGKGCGEPH